MDRRDLQRMTRDELDRLYIDSPQRPRPQGRFVGTHLCWLPPARKLSNAPFILLEWLAFDVLPWGIDFDDSLWWVGLSCLRGGRFETVPERSRWRPTECQQMRYHRDWFPPFRWFLYDEVKALSDDLCLGIGGVNRPEGLGDHFYYALSR
jgi:hypothetical protein